MPTPRIFMKHFNNVVEAQRGNRTLSYADGSQVSYHQVEDLYRHLTTNYKDIFTTSDLGAWTWLNARFNEKRLLTVTGANKNGLVEHSSELEEIATEDCCYISLKFNNQGLAQKEAKAKQQSYVAGENIYFRKPVDGAVAKFVAASDWAGLICDRNPSYRNVALGVFACAECTSYSN